MNDELIQQLIDVIKTHPKRYDQDSFGVESEIPRKWVIEGSCGSPCCIASHVMILTNNNNPNEWGWFKVTDYTWKNEMCMRLEEGATEKLGITRDQGNALFCSMWSTKWKNKETGPLPLVKVLMSYEPRFKPNSSQAIQVLELLLQYGFSHSTFEEYYNGNA